jgi:hypothetical protein
LTDRVEAATARKTALTVAIVLGLIGSWQVYRARPTATAILLGLGLLLAVVAFIPPAARGFHRGWMRIAETLGWVNTRILLTLVYYGLLTPVGVLRKYRHDPLTRRAAPKPSYWVSRERTRQSREGFERAF